MRDRAETPAPPGHGKERVLRARSDSAEPLASLPNSDNGLGYFILSCIETKNATDRQIRTPNHGPEGVGHGPLQFSLRVLPFGGSRKSHGGARAAGVG